MVVTVKVPVVVPLGTVTVKDVAVDALGFAVTPPLKLTTLLEGVVLNPVPAMVITFPIPIFAGVNEVMVGTGWIVKELPDTALNTPFVVTVKVPVVAAVGTVTVKEVVVAVVETAVLAPPKVTVLFAAVASKFDPLMVIAFPIP